MFGASNVFLEFNLPNPTTWFYFSLLLAIALFFKFGRLLSIRNLDVLLLYLIVPGLLLIQQARTHGPANTQPDTIIGTHAVALSLGQGLGAQGNTWAIVAAANHPAVRNPSGPNWIWIGYLTILIASGFLFFRCLLDLALEQRPALSPNLMFGGSAWLAGALFVCLTAVAFRQSEPDRIGSLKTGSADTALKAVSQKQVGSESSALTLAKESMSDAEWLTRSLAVACHFLIVVGLVVIGRWHFQDLAGGMAAATLYLILPYTGMFVAQAHHAWPAALVVWAVAAYRRPTIAGILLGVAAATAYFPALILPLWLSFYWRRGAGRFILANLLTLLLCLSITGSILWWQGQLHASLQSAFQYAAWQPWLVPPPGTEGFWAGTHWAYRIPLFIAFVAFWILTPFWPMPKNLAHVMAMSAAVFIGIQFWYANQGGVYVLWYLPLLLLLVFRPNLEDRRAAVIDPDADWVTALGRRLASVIRWGVGKRETVKAEGRS